MAVTFCRSVKLLRFTPQFKQCTLPFSSELVVSKEPEDKVTHTGQHWEKDDLRLARYIDKSKQVNEHFAIDLINSIPPKPMKDRVVWCNGGGGALGHPKVYINLDQPGPQACGYCGLRFILEQKHH